MSTIRGHIFVLKRKIFHSRPIACFTASLMRGKSRVSGADFVRQNRWKKRGDKRGVPKAIRGRLRKRDKRKSVTGRVFFCNRARKNARIYAGVRLRSFCDGAQYIPSIPPWGIATAGAGSLISVTSASVVSRVAATLAAFCNALLVTLVGSRIPALTISQ